MNMPVRIHRDGKEEKFDRRLEQWIETVAGLCRVIALSRHTNINFKKADMGLVIAFAGEIGSGKSSISKMLETALGWPRVGFGDYLRVEVRRSGGNPNCREALQELGQSLVDAHPESFCRSVLRMVNFRPGGDLLVDGIRHVNIQVIMQRIVLPSETKLVYLSADSNTRYERIRDRNDGQSDFARASQHRVEGEAKNCLTLVADAIVDTRIGAEDPFEVCLRLVRSWSR